MVDIHHTVYFDAPADQVFAAVSTRDGYANWWNRHVEGDAEPGGEGLRFEFQGQHSAWRTIHREPDRLFEMENILDADGSEWLGTRLRFEITPTDSGCTLRFTHIGWAEPTDFHHHCSYVWGFFLHGLKQYVQTGTGAPMHGDQPIRL